MRERLLAVKSTTAREKVTISGMGDWLVGFDTDDCMDTPMGAVSAVTGWKDEPLYANV